MQPYFKIPIYKCETCVPGLGISVFPAFTVYVLEITEESIFVKYKQLALYGFTI